MNEFIEQLTDAGRTSSRSLRELGEIQTRALRRATQIHYSLASLGIDGTIEQARLITRVSSYPEYLAAQSDLTGKCGSRLVEITREAADALNASREEYTTWVKKSFEPAANETPPPASRARSKVPARKRSAKKKTA